MTGPSVLGSIDNETRKLFSLDGRRNRNEPIRITSLFKCDFAADSASRSHYYTRRSIYGDGVMVVDVPDSEIPFDRRRKNEERSERRRDETELFEGWCERIRVHTFRLDDSWFSNGRNDVADIDFAEGNGGVCV